MRKLRGEPSPAFTLSGPRKIKVNCWGCITGNGVRKIFRISDGFNGEQYAKLLKTVLTDLKKIQPDFTFMQDNASIHKVEVVTTLFHDLKIPTLNWPPKSPDLNPIENIWGLMQNRLNKVFDNDGEPESANELFCLIEKVWNEIKPEEIRNLYQSLPKRIQGVLNANGCRTKY